MKKAVLTVLVGLAIVPWAYASDTTVPVKATGGTLTAAEFNNFVEAHKTKEDSTATLSLLGSMTLADDMQTFLELANYAAMLSAIGAEPAKGADDNYVTDAEKAALHTEVTRDSLGVDTDDSPTFAGILADTITEKTADAGVTIENVELKDGQISTAAVASPDFILNDSDSPGTDKDSGGLSSQYVDGADGSENSSVELEAMANGLRVSGISIDGQSDGTVEIVMNGPVTFPAGDISSAAIGNDQIDSQHYAAASIDNEHLADDAVDSDELAASAVDLAHMSANSVDSDQYVDGSIDNAHLADDAVDSDEIADGAVDVAHVEDDLKTNIINLVFEDVSTVGTAAAANKFYVPTGFTWDNALYWCDDAATDAVITVQIQATTGTAFATVGGGGTLTLAAEYDATNDISGWTDPTTAVWLRAYISTAETGGDAENCTISIPVETN